MYVLSKMSSEQFRMMCKKYLNDQNIRYSLYKFQDHNTEKAEDFCAIYKLLDRNIKLKNFDELINEKSYIIFETTLFDEHIIHSDKEHSVMITLDLPESDECVIIDELSTK